MRVVVKISENSHFLRNLSSQINCAMSQLCEIRPLVYSFFVFFECVIDNVCGCLLFELVMMKVMPYDPSREEVYNAYITKT